MEPQVGAAYRQVSRKEAGMRFLLMQMANAATRQVSDPDRGLELLGTALTSLHTVLTALRSSPPSEDHAGSGAAATVVEASAAARAELLRLRPAVQEAYGLLALPVPAAVKFLEAVHYEKTPAGDLVLDNPEREEVQSAVEGGLNALEWFERQNSGGADQDASQGQFTLGHNPLMMMGGGGGQALLCCPPHQRASSAPGGKPS